MPFMPFPSDCRRSGDRVSLAPANFVGGANGRVQEKAQTALCAGKDVGVPEESVRPQASEAKAD